MILASCLPCKVGSMVSGTGPGSKAEVSLAILYWKATPLPRYSTCHSGWHICSGKTLCDAREILKLGDARFGWFDRRRAVEISTRPKNSHS